MQSTSEWRHSGAAVQLAFISTRPTPACDRKQRRLSIGKAKTTSIPMKHLGSVEDIAFAALFFASDEAAYITGQTLVVDGGPGAAGISDGAGGDGKSLKEALAAASRRAAPL